MKTMFFFIALFVFSDCSVHKNVQKNSLHVDSTGTASKQIAIVANLHQTGTDSAHSASFANSQSDYTSQTVEYQFTAYTGGDGGGSYDSAAGSLPVSIPAALQRRLAGMKVTTERGQQAKQAGGTFHRNKQWQTDGQDSISGQQKQTTDLTKDQQASVKNVTRSGISWWVWVVGGLLLVAGAIAWGYFKGWWGIFGLVKKKLTSNPQQS